MAERHVVPKGWRRFVSSFAWAWRGLAHSLRTQANARVHLLAAVAALALGCWLGLARWEWCAVCGAIALVWMAETFNTAIEMLVDLVSPETRAEAGRIKDVAAGAVLAAAIGALAIGALVFLPKLWALLAYRGSG